MEISHRFSEQIHFQGFQGESSGPVLSNNPVKKLTLYLISSGCAASSTRVLIVRAVKMKAFITGNV